MSWSLWDLINDLQSSGGGAEIDDNVVATDKTWSSSKIVSELGGWKLLGEIEIKNSSERTSQISITGLDLQKDEAYLLLYNFVWGELGYKQALLYLNNDFNNNNYFFHWGVSSTAGGGIASGNGTRFIRFPNAWGKDFSGKMIICKHNYYSAFALHTTINPTFSDYQEGYISYNKLKTNITSLHIATDSILTDFFWEGTKVKIFKLRR